MDIQARIEFLTEEIKRHNTLYYENDKPEISDAEYDILFRELRDLEDSNPEYLLADSPTRKVGGKAVSGFEEAVHLKPMLSIDNAMDSGEASKFNQAVRDELLYSDDTVVYCAEPKYDGLSNSLVYENGIYARAATRGDGTTGENVTAQIATIKTIPQDLRPYFKAVGITVPTRFEVRGEVLMQKKTLETLNEIQRSAGAKEFANCRNAAAGAVRNLDPAITASRNLDFYAYALGVCDGVTLPDSQIAVLNILKEMGFTVSEEVRLVKGFDGMKAFYEDIASKRAGLPFDIDGTVFKTDKLSDQEQLGWVGRCPKWAIAWKFPPEERETELLAIDIQIGRTGVATPVARLNPVKVGGVTVANATLHNESEIRAKDVRVGDLVVVRRAGDVIPEIVRPVLDSGHATRSLFSMPDTCPECGSPLAKEDDKVAYRCMGGLTCPAQAIYSVSHFASRLAMDIDGLAEKTIQALFEASLLTSVASLYDLSVEDAKGLPGFAQRSAEKLIESIEKSKKVKLHKFIYALGLPGVGEATAKAFANQFKSWATFRKASYEDLIAISDVGSITASEVVKYFLANALVLNKLELAVQVEEISSVAGKFTGSTFVLTGALAQSREYYKELLEAQGAKISESVGKKTTAVIAGENAGTKLAKATTLGVPVWSEEDLLNKL